MYNSARMTVVFKTVSKKAGSVALNCDIGNNQTMVWQNHCSNKIEDFTIPTKSILSCYFCQLLRCEIFYSDIY